MAQTLHFHEIQRFTQWWLWALLLLVAATLSFMLYALVFPDPPVADTTFTKGLVWLSWLIFAIGLPLFFLLMRLTTEVHDDHIMLRFFPLTTRKLLFSEIEKYEIHDYRPIQDFGGWGIRSKQSTTAYNTGGNRGILITMRDGQHILIGSRQVERFAQALEVRIVRG